MIKYCYVARTLRWRHNELDGVSNHQHHDYLLNRLFGHRSKKTSKLRVTGLCARNSPGTGEFPAQMASNAENVSIWWRHHEIVSVRPYTVNFGTFKRYTRNWFHTHLHLTTPFVRAQYMVQEYSWLCKLTPSHNNTLWMAIKEHINIRNMWVCFLVNQGI